MLAAVLAVSVLFCCGLALDECLSHDHHDGPDAGCIAVIATIIVLAAPVVVALGLRRPARSPSWLIALPREHRSWPPRVRAPAARAGPVTFGVLRL